MIDLREMDAYRERAFDYRLGCDPYGDDRRFGGAFRIPVSSSKRPLLVIASSGDMPGSPPWDHVSVSLPGQCPTWAEMDTVKRLFFRPAEVAMQLHVPESEHISNHRYCLHLWRHVGDEIPMPPAIMVGIKELGELPL